MPQYLSFCGLGYSIRQLRLVNGCWRILNQIKTINFWALYLLSNIWHSVDSLFSFIIEGLQWLLVTVEIFTDKFSYPRPRSKVEAAKTILEKERKTVRPKDRTQTLSTAMTQEETRIQLSHSTTLLRSSRSPMARAHPGGPNGALDSVFCNNLHYPYPGPPAFGHSFLLSIFLDFL